MNANNNQTRRPLNRFKLPPRDFVFPDGSILREWCLDDEGKMLHTVLTVEEAIQERRAKFGDCGEIGNQIIESHKFRRRRLALTDGLNARQIERISRIRADRKRRSVRAEAERALANPSNLVELSSYAVLKETLRIDAERQEELKAILQLCRTEGEVEVPAVCYECGFEGKCLVVEGDDSDWLCLDCSCIS
jgi:hypothetical protein